MKWRQKKNNVLDYALKCSVLASCDWKGINIFLWKWKPWKTFSKDQGTYLLLQKKPKPQYNNRPPHDSFRWMILHPLISLANLAQVLRDSQMTFFMNNNIPQWTSATICQCLHSCKGVPQKQFLCKQDSDAWSQSMKSSSIFKVFKELIDY